MALYSPRPWYGRRFELVRAFCCSGTFLFFISRTASHARSSLPFIPGTSKHAAPCIHMIADHSSASADRAGVTPRALYRFSALSFLAPSRSSLRSIIIADNAFLVMTMMARQVRSRVVRRTLPALPALGAFTPCLARRWCSPPPASHADSAPSDLPLRLCVLLISQIAARAWSRRLF